MLDISTSVVVGKNKYNLEKVMRNEKNEVRRMKLVVKSLMKSSITGIIKLADVQDDDQEKTPVKKMKAVKKDKKSKSVMKSVMLKGPAWPLWIVSAAT